MHSDIFAYCLVIISFAWIAILPFVQKKPVRARWAKISMCLCGVVGLVNAIISLILHVGWVVVSSHTAHQIHGYLLVLSGLFLGILLSLIISGQLKGTKQE